MNHSEQIREKRSDLTPFLFHYTNNFETLKLIVRQLKLKGKKDYICFAEAPLTQSLELFDYFHEFKPTPDKPWLKPMYKPYGLGILRMYLFNNGARPLIYGTPDELDLIPIELKWRCMELHMVKPDYSWLREWRINSGVFDFSTYRDEIILITITKDELDEICENVDFDVDYGYESEIGGCIPYLIDTRTRLFKGIAIEEIIRSHLLSDNQIVCHIGKQEIGENFE